MAIDTLSLDFGSDKKFYVYLYRDPRPGKKNQPIYVGKGATLRDRADYHWKYGAVNRFLDNVLNKIRIVNLEPIIEVISWFDDENKAFALEIALITRFGRRDKGLGPLLNMTDGGEGMSGLIVLPETLEKMSNAQQRVWLNSDEETKKRMLSGVRWGVNPDADARRIQSMNTTRTKVMANQELWAAQLAASSATKNKPENRKAASEKQKAHLASLTPEEKAIRDGNAGDARRADRPETGKRSVAMWARDGQKEKQGAAIGVGQKSAWDDPIKGPIRRAKLAATAAKKRAAKEATAIAGS